MPRNRSASRWNLVPASTVIRRPTTPSADHRSYSRCMALQFDIQAAPPLQLTPSCTIYTGTVRLTMKGRFFESLKAPPDEFGVFVPDVPPLLDGALEPRVWAEAYAMSTVSTPASGFPSGVQYVRATYLADPRGGDSRWLHLGGAAYVGRGIALSYRLTVQNT